MDKTMPPKADAFVNRRRTRPSIAGLPDDQILGLYRAESAAALQAPINTITGDYEIKRSIMPPKYASGCYTMRFNVDGKQIIAGFGNGCIIQFDKDDITGYHTKQTIIKNGTRYVDDNIMSVRYHPKEPTVLFSASLSGSVLRHQLDAKSDKINSTFKDEEGNKIYAMDLNMTGDFMATGGKDLDLRVYDTKTATEIHKYKGYHLDQVQEGTGHAMKIFCIKFHPDQREIFLSAGWDNVVKIWDLRTDSGVVGQLNGLHICGDGIDIKGEWVLTGSWRADDAIQLWDFRQRKVLKSFPVSHTKPLEGDNVYSVHFIRSDSQGHVFVTAGSGSNTFQIIDHHQNKVICHGHTEKPFHTIDTHGNTCILAGGDGWIRVVMKKTN